MNKIILILSLFFVFDGYSQKPVQWSSSEILKNFQKLNVQARVLYLAAHPDDENTRFIAYCANNKLAETAYMSLTRGDGGQNLIGPELREELGLIRTQELLMARSVDGGNQFFSRANDFGYSKNPEETFRIWNKEKVLGDLVYVIRAFQPDIIVCRFPNDGRGGHGHHTASALLGEEAFDLAADPNAYSEQLNELSLWQAKRIVTNTGRWWNDSISAEDPHVVVENIGEYETLLGISCNEIAAESRSQHKSQGFGSTGVRGEQLEYFEHVKGDEAKKSLFDGVDFSWKRISGGGKIEKQINKLIKKYDAEHPENSIDLLFDIREAMLGLTQERRVKEKIVAVEKLIVQCGGIYLEAKTDKYAVASNDSVQIDLEVVARQAEGFIFKGFQNKDLNWTLAEIQELKRNTVFSRIDQVQIPDSWEKSNPYWLRKQGTLGTYHLERQSQVLRPDNGPATFVTIELEYKGKRLFIETPVVYKENDPVKGEVYKPFYAIPDVSLRVEKDNLLIKKGEWQKLDVFLKVNRSNFTGNWDVQIPNGWKIKEFPKQVSFREQQLGEIKYTFELLPTDNAESGVFSPRLIKGKDEVYDKEIKFIEYDHIPTQIFWKPSSVKLNVADIQIKGKKVAYFEGAGDVIPEALRLVGYTVDIVTHSDLDRISEYDAVVLGIRALNTNNDMKFILPKLFDYVKEGGNLIVQYNTSHRLVTQNIAPFPLTLSRDRVTDENAEIRFLAPEHPILNTPNKITQEDFDNWVQERGLYFPNKWSEDFTPILAANDTGETSKSGPLLVAKYGEGNYIYTGLSFFRELPAGVPGAYRLLVNLISLGHE